MRLLDDVFAHDDLFFRLEDDRLCESACCSRGEHGPGKQKWADVHFSLL